MDDGAVGIVTVIFSMPVAIVGIRAYYKYKIAQLRERREERQLEQKREEQRQLEARVQNLESIVCSVDLELNARLNRLAAAQSGVLVLPQASGGSAAAAAPGTLLAGQRVGERYTIVHELGRGGMGVVYLASDEKLGEKVALKVIHAGAGQPEAIERFRREVAQARKVTHPNVVRIHDLVEDGATVLLSMEYVEGMTLAAYLARRPRLEIDEARHLLGQICDGVAAAHAAGVVHRDLKPANVLLDAEKRVKVIDFGLAKSSFLAGMTATGLIVGTPEYMAPEQVKGLPQDARTDVYALGAMAYHLLTGQPPFVRETPIAVGFAHATEAPVPPRGERQEIPPTLESAVLRALAKEPSERFADAAELKRALLA